MGGIARKRDPAEGPFIDRILVDHWIFQDLVGVADHLRHVEPFEVPVLVERKKVGKIARLVPVILRKSVALDLGHPVDELAPLAVDAVYDRVDDDLACQDRANPHISAAIEDWLASRYAAPRINAGKCDLVLGIKLLADRRIDPFTINDHVGANAAFRATGTCPEMNGRSLFVLFDADAFVIGADRVGAQSVLCRLEQNHMETAAMYADFRKFVSRQSAARLLIDELAKSVVETALLIFDTGLE